MAKQILEAGNTKAFFLFRKLISRSSSLHCFCSMSRLKLPQLWHTGPCGFPDFAWGEAGPPEFGESGAELLLCPRAAPPALPGGAYEISSSRWALCWADLHVVGQEFVLFWCLCLWRLWMVHTQIMTEFQAQSSAVTSPSSASHNSGVYAHMVIQLGAGLKCCFHSEVDNLTDSFNVSLGSAILILNHNLFIFPTCDVLVVVVLVTQNK